MIRPLVPTWEAAFEELTAARVVRAPISAGIQGVRFDLEPPGRSIVFWTGKGSEIVDYLEEQGVRVDREVISLHFFSNS